MSDGKDAVREIFKRLNQKQMKLIYFSAPWCGPCKTFGPIMEQVSRTYQVQKVNVDQDTTLSAKYGIRNVPTVVKVDANGNMVDKFVGVKSMEQIGRFING
ncbi:thioredoxin family protein [Haliea sp.]|uniref:thioredoxin family protein n=1 Tax=Haliea sp. TaxID=1932666 RepID=UPI000C4C1346|nr:thioredoxin family protein [Haliea sp.]MAD65503.1 thiol reductase thioredoxin [Haliea sp.]